MNDGTERLVRALADAGDLPSGLGELLRSVDRGLFIPDRIWVDHVPLDRSTHPDDWQHAVYSDRSIVTRYDDGRTDWPHVGRVPTSSASAPSVVAAMLELLGVHEGHAVLEIGTGTGYNAALLAEAVGPTGSVLTIEVDPVAADGARERLAHAGYDRVRMMVADGTAITTAPGSLDRVVATAAVHVGRIPYAWVEQTRPGGVIVAPVRADLTSGPLVRLVVDDDGVAVGRMADFGVGFMEVRSHRTAATSSDQASDVGLVTESTTTTVPWPMFTDAVARWALALALPSCRYDMVARESLRLADPVTGSWATVAPGDDGLFTVRQAGLRRLWDEAHVAYRWWLARGRPTGPDWVWTVAAHRQTVRLGPAGE